MAAAKKKSEPSATFTLNDVSVTVPLEVQGDLARTEKIARQELHRLADFGAVEFKSLPDPEPEPEPEPAAE